MHLLLNQMKASRSIHPFFKHLRAVQEFWLQCSTTTSANTIKRCFTEASEFRGDSIPIVVLEEVGLAEGHPSLPLKVLHGILDDALESANPVGFVGLSNWILDPAKLNRSINLFKAELTKDDLNSIATGIVPANLPFHEHQRISDDLHAISETYWSFTNAPLVKEERHSSTIKVLAGARDFFALCRAAVANGSASMEEVARSFGTSRPPKTKNITRLGSALIPFFVQRWART
jgi:hypothetical protein